jgi:RHS repeat-associated protein
MVAAISKKATLIQSNHAQVAAATPPSLESQEGVIVDKHLYNSRHYDPSVGKFLTVDPSGFDAGDTNLTRYVGNDPINYTDPTGLYREPFLKATPEMPKDWRVHHTKMQAFRDLYLKNGIDVDDQKFLRGVPPCFHDEISDIQNGFIQEFAERNGLKKNDWAGIKKIMTMEELDKLEAAIESKYSDLWTEAGKTPVIANKIKGIKDKATKFAANNADEVKDLAVRKAGAADDLGIKLGIIGVIGLLFSNAELAGAIINPDRDTVFARDEMLLQYRLCEKDARRNNSGVISQKRLDFLKDSIRNYLRQLKLYDKYWFIFETHFNEQMGYHGI